MFKMALTIPIVAFAWATAAQAEKASMPNLAGNYRCTPDPTPCPDDAAAFTVTQKGNRIDFKSDKGRAGYGEVTSPTTIAIAAPWNMLGIVRNEGQIDWSNGTIWRKQ